MAIPLKQILDELPPKRRADLDRRYMELVRKVESLEEVRLPPEASSKPKGDER
jgi:RNase P subunit RPR2